MVVEECRRPPERVQILYPERLPGAVEVGEKIRHYLASRIGAVVLASLSDGRARMAVPEQDMLIVLGGDGTMLRGERLAAPYGVPVLGINLGHLAFLAEAQRDEWPAVVDQVLAGNYRLEERMMLNVEHHRDHELAGVYDVLNEAVVGRGALARPVRLRTLIDGGWLTTYVADGLIIATPTGSTAYALSVGGPILPPELKNILLAPIAPHLSLEHAIVLAQGVTVEVQVRTEHQAILSADGQVDAPLLDGDWVRVRMSRYVARFVRVQPPSYFYTRLMARMWRNPAAEKEFAL